MQKDINIDIKKVTMAHEFTLYKNQKCDYAEGRRVCGLCFVLSGEMLYKISSGENFVFKEGDVFFMPPGIAYTAVPKSDFKHFTINFIAKMESECGLPVNKITSVNGVFTGRFRNLFRETCELYKYKSAGYSMKAVGYAYALMGEFADALYEQRMTSSNGKNLRLAKEFIDKNYSKSITIGELASIASMSETNFRREFKRLFSESPMHYRDRVRLSYAKEFLGTGIYNVGEVSELIGMEDEGYFCRFFKKHTGLTPKEYAKQKI